MKTPEAREKDKICKYLDSIGAWYCKPYMAGYGKRGVPDIIACINGKFVAIEVKATGKRLTLLQNYALEQISFAGGITAWGTSADVLGKLKLLY